FFAGVEQRDLAAVMQLPLQLFGAQPLHVARHCPPPALRGLAVHVVSWNILLDCGGTVDEGSDDMNEGLQDHSHSGHSRWGTNDQLGEAILLTLERRLSALRSIQTGALYDLSHEISPKAPFLLPNQTPFLQSIWASWRDSIRRRRLAGATNDAGSNVER